MKRLQLCAVVLLIVAVAVTVALVVNDNQASAFSTGWNGGCGTCHSTTGTPSSGTGVHAVSAHGNLGCTQCHATVGDAPALAKCVVCHGSVAVIAAKTTHAANNCASCHPAATTTTQASTTTTASATTTSTTAPTTTSTTRGTTSTTTAPTTTSTTVPTGEIPVTG
jgi:hypothetical protein